MQEVMHHDDGIKIEEQRHNREDREIPSPRQAFESECPSDRPT
jgi:hypothetical protein